MQQDDDHLSSPKNSDLQENSPERLESKRDTSDQIVSLIKDVAELKGRMNSFAIKEDLIEIKGSIPKLGLEIKVWVLGGVIAVILSVIFGSDIWKALSS